MAAVPDDIFFATITEINQKLKAREFSAVELTRAFLDRLESLGPGYNALALSLRRSALRSAKDVDDDLKRERFRGPLQGIPFGAKDLLSVAKLPTTWGARPYATQTFDYTATVLKKLQKAGSILIGKLALVELAGGGGYRYASASLTGPGLNPWDRTRWSGGSSSGSGIAVAAGLVPFALGSETGSSIVDPSAYCGVTGLRPTYGLVSRYGAMSLSWTMDKIGALCRSADDCGIVLQAIAGADDNDAGSAHKSFYYAPQYNRALNEIKIGLATTDFDEWAEPAARPVLAKALDVVRGLGVGVAAVKLPPFPYSALAQTVITSEAASIFESLIQSGGIDQLADQKQIATLKAAAEIPAKDYLRAMRIRTLLQDAFRDIFADVDVLLAPTRPGPAPKVNEPLDTPSRQPRELGLSQLTLAANLAGLPGISLPCGLADGMPVAIQLVGRPFSENTLLLVGREFQKVTDWHRRRPPGIAVATA
jgi:aspartyl-tRNA(Asn)/glutamyl-tRNA(Gln) amidotransferase subunit A